jgi:hypothetical protein
MKKVHPTYLFVPCRLGNSELAAGIRLNADSLRHLHINGPPQFPFGIQLGQGNARIGLGQEPGSNKHLSNSDRMFEKIRVAAFLLFF